MLKLWVHCYQFTINVLLESCARTVLAHGLPNPPRLLPPPPAIVAAIPSHHSCPTGGAPGPVGEAIGCVLAREDMGVELQQRGAMAHGDHRRARPTAPAISQSADVANARRRAGLVAERGVDLQSIRRWQTRHAVHANHFSHVTPIAQCRPWGLLVKTCTFNSKRIELPRCPN